MKKKIYISSILILIIIIAIASFQYYTNYKIKEYLNHLQSNLEPFSSIDISGELKLKKILKNSLKELVILVNCGEDIVYISIEDWLSKKHNKIEIQTFDKNRGIIIYH